MLMLNFIKNRKLKFALFGLSCVFVVFVWGVYFWQSEISKCLADMSEYLRDSVDFFEDIPIIFYALAIFILPLFFLPVTPIYFIAAARIGEYSYAEVLLICLIGVTANIVVSFFVSRKFGLFFRRILSRKAIRIPTLSKTEDYELTLLMRMIPGNPLTVQNYVLGAANVAFPAYLIISLPIQYIQIATYIYFGEGIFEGGFSKIILGSSLLLVIAIIARILEKRYGHKLVRKNGISKTE